MLFICAPAPPVEKHSHLLQPELIGTFEAVERGALIATPCVTADRVFLAAIRDTGLQPTGAIHCLDRKSLKPVWVFDDGGSMLHMFSSPTVANGRLYVGEGMHANFTCRLYSLDEATGQKVWTSPAESHIESTPVVVRDRLYIAFGDEGAVCLDATNGRRIWKLDQPAHIDTTPVVGDGVVYFGSGISKRIQSPSVYCLDAADGRVRWKRNTDLPVWATPTLAKPGRETRRELVVGLGNGRLLEGPRQPEKPRGAVVSLNPTSGEQHWRFDDCDAVFGAPAFDADRVYFGSRNGRCYSLERSTGREVWAVHCGSPIVAGPVWAGSQLVVSSSAGRIVGINPATGGELWRFDIRQHTGAEPRILTAPAVLEQDGRFLLYVATEQRSQAGSAAMLFVLRL